MMKHLFNIAPLLWESYKNHSITALLLNPDNLLINKDDHHKIKFNNLLTGIMLDNTTISSSSMGEGEQISNGLYVEGIDCIKFINPLNKKSNKDKNK